MNKIDKIVVNKWKFLINTVDKQLEKFLLVFEFKRIDQKLVETSS